MAYGRKGELDLAIQNYNKALELKPDYTDAYNNRGLAYGRKGELDLAIQNYDKALELKPDYAETSIGEMLTDEKTNLTLLSKTMIKR